MPLKLSGKQKVSCVFVAVVVMAGCLCFFSFSSRPRDLNVVLITIDALRADHLGCYGYRRNTSPNIDALSRRGALFTQAVAQSSHTPASIGVITTSAYPPTNQLFRWGGSIQPETPTIAETLRAYGYKTVFVCGAGTFLKGFHGINRGFDAFYDETSSASTVTRKAAEFLKTNGSEPFFMWLHYMDVHDYVPAKEFEGLYVNDRFYDKQSKLPIVKPMVDLYGYNGISEFRAEKSGGIDNPDYYIALYDSAIRSVDQQIGLLLEELRQASGARNTLVIITADHGEMLGEHGYYFHHGAFLYEPLIKIPFILYCPGIIPTKRVDLQISASLDVFSTIIGVLKIKKHREVRGIDVGSLLAKGGEGSSSGVFSDEGYLRVSVRTREWKLIYHRPSETYELFHLKSDPEEMHNLAPIESAHFASLKERLDEYDKKFLGAKAPPPILSEETRKRLKALGYLQ